MTREAESRSRDPFALHDFFPLLLKLYEQAEEAGESGLRDECLDHLDELLSNGFPGAGRAVEQLDRGELGRA